MSLYVVIEFTEEYGATAVVSSTWLRNNEKYCCWPGGTNTKLNKLVESHAKPECTWYIFPCKVLHKYESYKSARKGCQKSEYTSNIDTSANEATSRNIKRRRRLPVVTQAKFPSRRVRTASRSSEISSASSGLRYVSESEPAVIITDCPTAGLLETTNKGIPQAQIQLFGTPKLQLVDANTIQTHAHLNNTPCSSRTSATAVRNHQIRLTPVALNFGFNQAAPDLSNFSSPTNSEWNPLFQHTATNDAASLLTNNVPVNSSPTAAETETRDSYGCTRFEKTVLEYLVRILDNQKELLRRAADPTNIKLPAMLPVTIPLDSIGNFNAFNQWLSAPAHLQNTCAELCVIGGQSIASITQRLLVALLTNRLAKELSLTGKGNKTQAGIKGTSLHKLIYDTVRLTKGGETATNSEIDSAIQKWLKGAPDREGCRKRRRTAICSNNNEGTPRGLDGGGE